MKTKNIRIARNESRSKRIHNSLIKDIKNMRKKLQQEADNRYGKKKIKITDVFASQVLSRRLKK